MKHIIRIESRAALREQADEERIRAALEACGRILAEKKAAGEVYTGGIFRHERMLFVYLELISETPVAAASDRDRPDQWLTPLEPYLKKWPEMDRDRAWAYMLPVFWYDVPKSYDIFLRREPPEKRCGRIAVLYPDKAMSYVCHHQAIAEEGLLVGDRYQFISIHENILFSYFETPRDREQVNVKRAAGESLEIQRWEAADPASHFQRFPQAPHDNFMVIETVVSV